MVWCLSQSAQACLLTFSQMRLPSSPGTGGRKVRAFCLLAEFDALDGACHGCFPSRDGVDAKAAGQSSDVLGIKN